MSRQPAVDFVLLLGTPATTSSAAEIHMSALRANPHASGTTAVAVIVDELAVAAEADRLAAVGRFEILDTPRDGAFDRIAAMAARLLDGPIATVTIVDEDRIWFKAAHGLDGVHQIGRDPGLCASAIQHGAPYVITDALRDPRTAANPLVTVRWESSSTRPPRSPPPTDSAWEP